MKALNLILSLIVIINIIHTNAYNINLKIVLNDFHFDNRVEILEDFIH